VSYCSYDYDLESSRYNGTWSKKSDVREPQYSAFVERISVKISAMSDMWDKGWERKAETEGDTCRE